MADRKVIMRAVTPRGELRLIEQDRELLVDLNRDPLSDGPWPLAELDRAVDAFHQVLRRAELS